MQSFLSSQLQRERCLWCYLRYEDPKADEYAQIRYAWLTFKETEPAAVTSMVCLIQKLQMQVTSIWLYSLIVWKLCDFV